MTEDGLRVWDHAFAIPNGLQLAGGPKARGRYMAALKTRGLRPGVSDVMLALPRGSYHGAFFELKRDTKSDISEEQLKFQALMRARGYYAAITPGWECLLEQLNHYLFLGRPLARPPE